MIYQNLVQAERQVSGNHSLVVLPERARAEKVQELTLYTCSSLLQSVTSDGARRAMETHKDKVQDMVRAGIERIFVFAGETCQERTEDIAEDHAHPSRFKGVTKRGMPQPKRKR
eukprot:TRINITY_DN102457_c0_g1_i1.p1 TRINITY_DN102457_c0_g1~~TRINITY_DN102457_c0_g1_i1.p1  ORF type:complete len:114 (-),score=15.22 TRINITY_DN102457_c0_g1_i1:193-534(-)